MGTVGAVAMDAQGRLIAGTSTGGTCCKHAGRVGDSPLIGCGCYADAEAGGVSCTGLGEAIMRVVMAKTAVEMLRAGQAPDAAAKSAARVLHQRGRGTGGLILLDQERHARIRVQHAAHGLRLRSPRWLVRRRSRRCNIASFRASIHLGQLCDYPRGDLACESDERARSMIRREFIFSAAAFGVIGAMAWRHGNWLGLGPGPGPVSSPPTPAAPDGKPTLVTIVKFSDAGERLEKVTTPKIVKTDAEWQQTAHAESVQHHATRRHRDGLHRRRLRSPRQRTLPLRLLRQCALQLGHEIRFRHRLAQLLGADRQGKYRRALG